MSIRGLSLNYRALTIWRQCFFRTPETIQLCDVYRGLGEETVLAVHKHPNKHCPIGENIKGSLLGIFASAQGAMVDSLSQYTIADILKDVRSRTGWLGDL